MSNPCPEPVHGAVLHLPGASVSGEKHDGGKPRWDLLPMRAVSALVDVLTYGARKYSPGGWRSVPEARSRYYAAAMRHLTLWWLGERLDPESGLPHLAHVMCNVSFLLEVELEGEQRKADEIAKSETETPP